MVTFTVRAENEDPPLAVLTHFMTVTQADLIYLQEML